MIWKEFLSTSYSVSVLRFFKDIVPTNDKHEEIAAKSFDEQGAKEISDV
jgi:hypothetical protein